MPVPAHRRLLVVLLATLAALILACAKDDAPRPQEDTSLLYVAIGASDSVGVGARDPATDGWVPQLHRKMPVGTRLANLGISGLRIHQAVEQVLPVAVDLQPNVITVWLAVNDLAAGVPLEAYHADLDTLLGALARDTRARVYIANVPDLTLLPAFRERPPQELRAEVLRWNDAIAASAAAHGAVLIDLYTGWQELRRRPDYISRDGFHPSTLGYRRLADLFWQAMQGA